MVGRPRALGALLLLALGVGSTSTVVGPSGAMGSPPGSIRVVAVVEGVSPAGFEPRIRVVCRANREVVAERTLRFADGDPRIVRGVEPGARCRIEQGSTGDELVIYDVNGDVSGKGPTFEIVAGETVHVTVTSSFASGTAVGTIRITKSVVGTPPAGATYVVAVRCGDRFPSAVTFPAAGGTEDVAVDVAAEPITCRVRETARGGADRTRTSPSRGVVSLSVVAPSSEIEISNTFE